MKNNIFLTKQEVHSHSYTGGVSHFCTEFNIKFNQLVCCANFRLRKGCPLHLTLPSSSKLWTFFSPNSFCAYLTRVRLLLTHKSMNANQLVDMQTSTQNWLPLTVILMKRNSVWSIRKTFHCWKYFSSSVKNNSNSRFFSQ